MPTLISSDAAAVGTTQDSKCIVMETVMTAKGEDVMATLSADDITQSGQGYTNNSLVEMTHCKSEDPIAVLDMQGGKIGANYQMGCDATPAITRGRGSADDVHSVAYHYAVRRITPIEGERLQGFEDGWTRPCFTPDQITDELCDRFIAIHSEWAAINGKPNAKPKSREAIRKWLTTISSADCPDGPRYKAIGNSMSVNVMSWIGQRIQQAEDAR